MGASPTRRRKERRWGVWTLAFLALAATSVLTSSALGPDGNRGYAALALVGLLVGLLGATVCTIRGLRSWGWLPRR